METKPPYLSYTTYQNALTRLREDGIPSRIDSSIRFLSKMSGGTQRLLLRTWEYMGLINEDARPLPILERLVNSEGAERQKFEREVLERAYPFIFATDNFDLTTATEQELAERFRGTGVSGETVQKCIAFFLQAAASAGITISRHIQISRPVAGSSNRTTSRRNSNGKSVKTPPTQEAKTINNSSDLRTTGVDFLFNSPKRSLHEMMIAKLPQFDPEWTSEVQEKWFDAFNRIWDNLGSEKELES